MYLATEVTRSFAWPEVWLATFQALSVVLVLIWIKVVLFRRRMAEEEVLAEPHLLHGDVFAAMKSRARVVPGHRPAPLRSAARGARNGQRSDKFAATSANRNTPSSSQAIPSLTRIHPLEKAHHE